jgi:hypothetical protein
MLEAPWRSMIERRPHLFQSRELSARSTQIRNGCLSRHELHVGALVALVTEV